MNPSSARDHNSKNGGEKKMDLINALAMEWFHYQLKSNEIQQNSGLLGLNSDQNRN